jgi:hypothetical protein
LDENQAKARLAEEGKATEDDAVQMGLREVLGVPQYLDVLREHCVKNHAQENLNFLGAVTVFEDAVSTTQSALVPLANQIYHEFLVQTANQLVNLTSAEFDQIEAKMGAGTIDSTLFSSACDNVYKMVAKDVYRRFITTPEAKKLTGASDAETLREYFTHRHARLSFSIVQRLEDIELMQKIETNLRQTKLLRTIRHGLKSWSDSIEGSALVTYLCKMGHAKTRAEGLSVAARLVEAGFFRHAIDSTLHFYDSENSSNIYQLPQQSELKKFPVASSLLQNPQNVSGFFLLRGVRYNRLWGIASVKDMHIYFWREDKQPHSSLPLKGVNMVFETGGELEEDDAHSGFAFGVRSEEKKEDKPSLRHGQVYLRVLMPPKTEKAAIPEAMETAEYVFLLEDASMRTRWRKCFEKECAIPTKMMSHQGVSKRAAITAQVAVRGVVNDRAEIVTSTTAVVDRRAPPVKPHSDCPPPEDEEESPVPPPPKNGFKKPSALPPETLADSPEIQFAMQNKERQAALVKEAIVAEAESASPATSPKSAIPVRPKKSPKHGAGHTRQPSGGQSRQLSRDGVP